MFWQLKLPHHADGFVCSWYLRPLSTHFLEVTLYILPVSCKDITTHNKTGKNMYHCCKISSPTSKLDPFPASCCCRFQPISCSSRMWVCKVLMAWNVSWCLSASCCNHKIHFEFFILRVSHFYVHTTFLCYSLSDVIVVDGKKCSYSFDIQETATKEPLQSNSSSEAIQNAVESGFNWGVVCYKGHTNHHYITWCL